MYSGTQWCARVCRQYARVCRDMYYQCSSQRQSQRVVLSQRSKHGYSLITFFQPHQKENCILKSGGAPLFHSLARTLITVEPLLKDTREIWTPLYYGHFAVFNITMLFNSGLIVFSLLNRQFVGSTSQQHKQLPSLSTAMTSGSYL